MTRKHPINIRSRIGEIRKNLCDDKNEFYTGDLAIQQKYAELYPTDPLPGITTINDILRGEGLSNAHHKKRRGTAKYLAYPVACVNRLGDRIAEVDFIGHKFIAGVSDSVHFLSVAYQKPARLRCIQRTNGETSGEAISVTKTVFTELGWPDVVRIDAGTHFTGRVERSDGKGARSVSAFAEHLLTNTVIPVFGAVRSPWNQGTVEGSNSVFGRNFWDAHTFTSLDMLDERIIAFNACSKKYAQWTPWIRETKDGSFIPRICFIRKVGEDTRGKNGFISVTSESISLPKNYIGLFVFVEWNLKEQSLKVFFEREGQIEQIKEIPFFIHPRSKERCTHLFRS